MGTKGGVDDVDEVADLGRAANSLMAAVGCWAPVGTEGADGAVYCALGSSPVLACMLTRSLITSMAT